MSLIPHKSNDGGHLGVLLQNVHASEFLLRERKGQQLPPCSLRRRREPWLHPAIYLDVIKINKSSLLQYQIKCAKNIKYLKNARFFLTNITFVIFFKHCLQMFMHTISTKCGPAAAGIEGALDTEGVQTDGALRYRFFFL